MSVAPIQILPLAVLMAHALAGIVTTGAAVHHGILSWRSLRGHPPRPRLQRLYPAVMAGGFFLTLAFGLWVYPDFVLQVRGRWMDAEVPWASAAFEVKEHWAGLALGAFIYLLPRSRTIKLRAAPADERLYHLTGLALSVIMVVGALIGELLTALRTFS